jgi:hypothetical protein
MGDKVLPSQSFKDKLNVHEKVIAKLDDYRVKPGEPTVLSGKIFPDRNDQHMSAQVKTPDGWKNFLSRDCRRDASFSVRIQAANVGRYKIRVFSQGKDNVMSGVSDVMTLEVRR